MKRSVKDPRRYMDVNPSLRIAQEDIEGTLQTLDEIRKLFGKNGQHWITDAFERIEDGINNFCLVGASQNLNGQYEGAARAAIAIAVWEREDGDMGSLDEDPDAVIINFNDERADWDDIKKIMKRAKEIVRKARIK